MNPEDELLFFDVVLYGPIQTIDSRYASLSLITRPPPAANDPEFGPLDAA